MVPRHCLLPGNRSMVRTAKWDIVILETSPVDGREARRRFATALAEPVAPYAVNQEGKKRGLILQEKS
jgi:hypothetical protein